MVKALENIVRFFQDMNPIVEKTVFLKFKAVDDALLPLSKNIGFEVDMLTVSTVCITPQKSVLLKLCRGAQGHYIQVLTQ